MSAKKRRRLCTSCDRPLRKGSSRRAWVMTADGELASGVVCARCALRAVAFVVPPATTLAPLCSVCNRAPATVCGDCHERVCSHVKGLSDANLALDAARRERRPS